MKMKIDTYSLQRAGQTNRSSQRQGYLAEQCKMLGGTVKSLVFRLEVKKPDLFKNSEQVFTNS